MPKLFNRNWIGIKKGLFTSTDKFLKPVFINNYKAILDLTLFFSVAFSS
jgi:hypothetical protein